MTAKKRPDYLRVLQNPEEAPQMGLPGMPPPIETRPEQPVGLTEDEQKVWDELLADAPEHVRDQLNRIVFETLVRATVQYREAAAKVQQYGAVIKSPSGYPIQSPYVSIQNKQAAIIQKASAELGLTLASRLRAKQGGKSKQKANPFEGLKSLE